MERFAKWEVSRELGEGGQGKVYLVHDADKHGALKKLHIRPDEPGYAKAKDRLGREVEALSMITHPNILKILDNDLMDAWFVGEYHAAGPLWTGLGRSRNRFLW
jgi:hypothetical protein